MNKTSIEWCDFSVNPIRFRPHGSERTTTICQKVSPGCTACYSESIVRRFWPKDAASLFKGFTAQGLTTGQFVLDEKQLLSVLKHKKPCKIFWGDMTDLFGEWVPFEMLDKCFAVCALTPHITHMFLTKRPERMLEYFRTMSTPERVAMAADGMAFKYNLACRPVQAWPLPNVWVGTSCENQKYADERIPIIGQVPAKVHFISAEPLIGEIDLGYPKTLYPDGPPMCCNGMDCGCQGLPIEPPLCYGLQLCIAGGESGPKARPMDPAWMRKLRDQCKENNIAFFAKQMGSAYGEHKGKDLPDDLNIRQFPKGMG